MKDKVIEKTNFEQAIDEKQFAVILHDFEKFLDFVAANDLEASGVNELLPLKCLRELNALLTKPLDIALKRPVQKSFANINGLFLLGRAGGLLVLKKNEKSAKFTVDREALDIWQSLNSVERYLTLVEIWIVRSSAEILGERENIFNSSLYSLKRLFDDLESKGENVRENKLFQQYLCQKMIENLK